MSVQTTNTISSRFPLSRYYIPFFIGLLIGLIVLSFILVKAVLQPQDPTALESQIRANCTVKKIDTARYRLEANLISNESLKIAFECPNEANYLMIRTGYNFFSGTSESKMRVLIDQCEPELIESHYLAFSKRYFFPLPKERMNNCLEITIENTDNPETRLIIDEMGLYRESRKPQEKMGYYLTLIVLVLGSISVLGFSILIFFPKKQATIYGIFFFFLLPIAVQFSLLFLLFSPNCGCDLKVESFLGSLTYTRDNVSMVSNILGGKGLFLGDFPPWCRMPGYPLILSLFGSHLDPYQTVSNGIILQIILFGLSLSFLFWSLLRIMPVSGATLIALIISFLPFKLFPIWIESIMPSVVLICSTAACLFIEQFYKNRKAPVAYHLFLHLSFALWFLVRADVIPAWALISLILYGKNWRSWKYFSIPIALFLLIGIAWALYKQPFTGNFSMTTESVGASLMGGLWEIPHKFIWSPTDSAYFSWMEMAHQPPTTKHGSDFAVREVFRFYCTYPIYTCSLIWHKFLLFSKWLWWTEVDVFYIIPWIRLLLLSVITTAFVIKFKRFQTLLLSWPVLFNAPQFFLFWSGEGRFWKASLISLLIAAIPLLLQKEFYLHASKHFTRVLVVASITASIILFGPMIDDYLSKNDSLKYWAPFLDPSQSTLSVERKL